MVVEDLVRNHDLCQYQRCVVQLCASCFLTRFHKPRSYGFAICGPYSALVNVNQYSDEDEELLVKLGLETVASSFGGGGSVSACRLSLSKGMLFQNVSLSISVKSSSGKRTNLGIGFRSANNHVVDARASDEDGLCCCCCCL